MGPGMLGYQHLRLPWELDDDQVGTGEGQAVASTGVRKGKGHVCVPSSPACSSSSCARRLRAGTRVATLLAAGLGDVRYRVDVGLAGAAGHVVGGVGGHRFAGTGLILEGRVTEQLEHLDAPKLLVVVRGKVADLGEMELPWP